MSAIGLDIGTKNIVMAVRGNDGKPTFIKEVNGYYLYPRSSKFIENMLDDPQKTRSDGTKRPAKWIKIANKPGIYVLGRDAEELAYAHNDTLLRPMAEGGVTQDEDAMVILASIIHGMLSVAVGADDEDVRFVGENAQNISLCYATTAPAINKSTNMDYHKQVVDLIIGGCKLATFNTGSICESHAIVLKECQDGTGIGISWGAGTVTASYVLWGDEIFSFCWVGAGDWIDQEVAKRHGYDPDNPKKKSRETPTTVCRVKELIDLSADNSADRLKLDISLHYRILVNNVVTGIVNGFRENENRARIDGDIPVFMAGGTSVPCGFVELFEQSLREHDVPFCVKNVSRCSNPLFAVSEGCLIAAEIGR